MKRKRPCSILTTPELHQKALCCYATSLSQIPLIRLFMGHLKWRKTILHVENSGGRRRTLVIRGIQTMQRGAPQPTESFGRAQIPPPTIYFRCWEKKLMQETFKNQVNKTEMPQFPARLIKNRNSAIMKVAHLAAAGPYTLGSWNHRRQLGRAVHGRCSYTPLLGEAERQHFRRLCEQIYKWLLNNKK